MKVHCVCNCSILMLPQSLIKSTATDEKYYDVQSLVQFLYSIEILGLFKTFRSKPIQKPIAI
jgi:hypothetical protein